MEFLEESPNFEINLQSDTNEPKKFNRKKSPKIFRSSLSSNTSGKTPKNINSNVVIFNINLERPTIIYDLSPKDMDKNPSNSYIKSESSENLNESGSKTSKNHKSELMDSKRKDNKLKKISEILDTLKCKNNYHLSSNTNLKLYGDLIPGPGEYSPQTKLYENKNLRYNNLYLKDEEPSLKLKLKLEKEKYFKSNIGPAYYNPNEGVIYKSYSQNPKIFISKLERGPLFKINDSLGPGQYNISKDFYKSTNRGCITNAFKNKNSPTQKSITNLRSLDTEYMNTFITNVNNNSTNTQNNCTAKDIKNESLNSSRIIEHLKTEQKSRYSKKLKNYSWKGSPDFSWLYVKKSNNDANRIVLNDNVNYTRQMFNFDNLNKLSYKNYALDPNSNGKIKNELLKYNNNNLPLIQNVQRDFILKNNHVPGPCYYKYINNSIEGDMQKLSKKNKGNNKWL